MSDTPRTDALFKEYEEIKDVALVESEIRKIERELAAAQARLHEIAEIYTGSEGFIPNTAPEDYQQRLLKQMYEVAARKEEK
jgi:hypothetical protein